MAAIKKDHFQGVMGSDKVPNLTTILRDVADDLATVAGAKSAPGALTAVAPAALTSGQNATTAAIDLPTSEALANALKANYNQLQADVAALRLTVAALVVDITALRGTAVTDAGAVGGLKTTKA